MSATMPSTVWPGQEVDVHDDRADVGHVRRLHQHVVVAASAENAADVEAREGGQIGARVWRNRTRCSASTIGVIAWIAFTVPSRRPMCPVTP